MGKTSEKLHEQILEILEENCNISTQEIALMVNEKEETVKKAIEELKDNKIILKNKSIINWEKTNKEFVTALIELKVTPQRGEGFDKIAERIYQYPEVKSVYLMAGAYDIMAIIEGRTLKEVSLFVSSKLAPMECVVGTSTYFVLKKFKDTGVIFDNPSKDDRQVITI